MSPHEQAEDRPETTRVEDPMTTDRTDPASDARAEDDIKNRIGSRARLSRDDEETAVLASGDDDDTVVVAAPDADDAETVVLPAAGETAVLESGDTAVLETQDTDADDGAHATAVLPLPDDEGTARPTGAAATPGVTAATSAGMPAAATPPPPTYDRPATTPVLPAAQPLPPERQGIRVGTVVWGLVVAAVGLGLVAFASGVVFDVELAFIILVAAAGVALLAGTLLGARRRGR